MDSVLIQLGDVIRLSAPSNPALHLKVMYVDYLDNQTVRLLNDSTLTILSISPDGHIDSIAGITLLCRSDTPSYAKQHQLLPGAWVNIRIEGKMPEVVVARIVSLEQDMIEVNTMDEKHTYYLNFDYKGIPTEWNIESIELRDTPPPPAFLKKGEKEKVELEKGEEVRGEEDREEKEKGEEDREEKEKGEEEEREELEKERDDVGPLNGFDHYLRDFNQAVLKARETANNRIFENMDNPPSSALLQRQVYDLATQTTDMLNEFLSTIPTTDRTARVLNQLHLKIERYVQIRAQFSQMDEDGLITRAIKPPEKPLATQYFADMGGISLPWIVPVVQYTKKIFLDKCSPENDYPDDVECTTIQSDITEYLKLTKLYSAGTLNYASYYNELSSDVLSVVTAPKEEQTSEIVTVANTRTRMGVVADNGITHEFMSSVWTETESIGDSAFVAHTFSPGLTKLVTTDPSTSRMITVREPMADADELFIKSFLWLPEPVMRYSKISLPSTTIYDQANLNMLSFQQCRVLNEKTKWKTIDLGGVVKRKEEEFTKQTLHFINDGNYSYEKYVDKMVPSSLHMFYAMQSYIVGKLSVMDVMYSLEPCLIYSDGLSIVHYEAIDKFVQFRIQQYKSNIKTHIAHLADLTNISSAKLTESLANPLVHALHAQYRKNVFSFIRGFSSVSEKPLISSLGLLTQITMFDGGRLYAAALAMQTVGLLFPTDFNDKIKEFEQGQGKGKGSKDLCEKNKKADACIDQPACIGTEGTGGTKESECKSMATTKSGLTAQVLSSMMTEFDSHTELSVKKVQRTLSYLESITPQLMKIKNNKIMEYNLQKYKLSFGVEDVLKTPISPYVGVLSSILTVADFAQQQAYIVRFAELYTRAFVPMPTNSGLSEKGEGEKGEHWRYCVQTGAPLLPTFAFVLADAFVRRGGSVAYQTALDKIKATVGKKSTDGDWWVDEYSGWCICRIDMDVSEGFDDNGFKMVSRSVIDADASTKIAGLANPNAQQPVEYTTKEGKLIHSVITTMSIAMGIKMSDHEDFIMNCAIQVIKDTVPSESEYNAQVRKMAERGKKIAPYEEQLNNSLMCSAAGAMLIAIQTAIPPIKTRKTYHGCVRSFSGFPFDPTQADFSGLGYVTCVLYAQKGIGAPWSALKGKKMEKIQYILKEMIQSMCLLPESMQRMKDKTDYLLHHTDDTHLLTDDHAVDKWRSFLPPLIPFHLTRVESVSDSFKTELLHDVRTGLSHQFEKEKIISSKIQTFSLAIIEAIQTQVKANPPLLATASNVPFVENACCEGNTSDIVINYFLARNDRMEPYLASIRQLMQILTLIRSLSVAPLFGSRVITKPIYPPLDSAMNEITVYLAFIHFCKFKQLAPIPTQLQSICPAKPVREIWAQLDTMSSAEWDSKMVQLMKDSGHLFTYSQFLTLLQTVGRSHEIPLKYTSPPNINKSMLTLVPESAKQMIEHIRSKDVSSLNNYLAKSNALMITEVSDYIRRYVDAVQESRQNVNGIIQQWESLFSWTQSSESSCDRQIQFYKNNVKNGARVFPSIIQHQMKYVSASSFANNDFSEKHLDVLNRAISEYYAFLVPFYGATELFTILNAVAIDTEYYVMISEKTQVYQTSSSSSSSSSSSKAFNARTTMLLLEHCLARVMVSWTILSKNPEMVVKAVPIKQPVFVLGEILDTIQEEDELEEYTSTRIASTSASNASAELLRRKVAVLLMRMIQRMHADKLTAELEYATVKDRGFQAKDMEKNDVVEKLKLLTDESRMMNQTMKHLKLGQYRMGLQSGLREYDKSFYDQEYSQSEMHKANEKAIVGRGGVATDDAMDELDTDRQLDQEALRENVGNDENEYGDEFGNDADFENDEYGEDPYE